MPIVSSKPSFVRRGVSAFREGLTPEFRQRTSSLGSASESASAKDRTDDRSERSHTIAVPPPASETAVRAPLAVRHAWYTLWPCCTSNLAALLPIPLLVPVMAIFNAATV